MSEAYEGRQIVGIDLHRRRSVLVRMTETGEPLETVRISNDPQYLAQVMEMRNHRDGAIREWSGFAILAIDCLIIETLGQFYNGFDKTPGRGKNRAAVNVAGEPSTNPPKHAAERCRPPLR